MPSRILVLYERDFRLCFLNSILAKVGYPCPQGFSDCIRGMGFADGHKRNFCGFPTAACRGSCNPFAHLGQTVTKIRSYISWLSHLELGYGRKFCKNGQVNKERSKGSLTELTIRSGLANRRFRACAQLALTAYQRLTGRHNDC